MQDNTTSATKREHKTASKLLEGANLLLSGAGQYLQSASSVGKLDLPMLLWTVRTLPMVRYEYWYQPTSSSLPLHSNGTTF